MRATVVFLSIALVACLGVLAALMIGTGRGYMYAPGIGFNGRIHGPIGWATTLAIAGATLTVVLHLSAYSRPKKYFQLLWWRDLAWVGTMLSALVVTLCYIGGLLTYGAH